MPPTRCFTFCELVLTFIGFIAGFSGFIYYAFVTKCHMSAVLAFSSGILASMTFHLHRIYLKNTITEWYNSHHFNNMQLLSFIGILIGGAFVNWNIFQQLYYDLPLDDISKNRVIPFIWALFVMLWGTTLFIASKRYYILTEEHQRLLPVTHRR